LLGNILDEKEDFLKAENRVFAYVLNQRRLVNVGNLALRVDEKYGRAKLFQLSG
jgi:hypothetical protein